MKGIELFVMERFIKDGRRVKLTINNLSTATLTSKQNARNHIRKMIEKGYVEQADDRIHPVYYRLSDLGFKVIKGIRNVQENIVVVK